jgi:hypothetical protein
VLSKNLVDDIRFQYRRIRDTQSAVSSLPSFGVQGSFTDGGSSSQSVEDHENNYELQNYFSGAKGAHSLNFGARLRAADDVNSSTSGSNGSYTFASLSDFVGCLQNPPAASCAPQQYTYTQINNPVAQATLFDAALFYQDDWKLSPRLTFSYGVRWETQNWIHDKNDWAPRVTVAYALGNSAGKQQPKTVVRAGYGWFYQRFTVANGFGANIPYVIQTIHQSEDRTHENALVVTDPGYFYPNTNYAPPPTSIGSGLTAPSYYSIAPNFHTAIDMEGAVGIDRQLSKTMTGNVTYVFSQGIHEYFTDNVSAAALFPADAAASGTYPTGPVSAPATNSLEYQSGGFYKEHQLMATVRATYRKFSLFTNYTYSNARGDTSGVGTVPSVSSYPGLDYGRTSFDVANRVMFFGNFNLPWRISFSPMAVANSGTPYNITTGTDLTGNNQFNARPTYAASCSEANTVQTQFGCLNIYPYGTGEKIIPYGVGTGPSNFSVNARLSKVIGIGPKLGEGQQAAGGGGGGFRGGPPGLGGGGFSGARGGPGRMDQGVSRKYSLTFSAWGTNILNHENLSTPNGVLQARPGPRTPAARFRMALPLRQRQRCRQGFRLRQRQDAGNFQKTGNFLPASSLAFDDSDWRRSICPTIGPSSCRSKRSRARQQRFLSAGPKLSRHERRLVSARLRAPCRGRGKRIVLEFDGAYRETMVVFNGFYIGQHSGGYDPFQLSMSPTSRIPARNVLLVRVDATESDGWFYEGAGIYRHVWLVKTSRPCEGSGEHLYPLRYKWRGHALDPHRVKEPRQGCADRARHLNDPRSSGQVRGKSGDSLRRPFAQAESRPTSRDRGQAAEAVVARRAKPLLAGHGGRVGGDVVDRYETPFGIRTIEFDRAEGLLSERQAGQGERHLQSPGPRRPGRGAARRRAVLPRPQAAGDGLQLDAHLA